MPNFYVINNPCAGGGEQSNIINDVKKMPNIVAWHDTKYRGHAVQLAKHFEKTLQDNKAVILVIGGDGSLHETLNGLLQASRAVAIPLAYIPTGSGNDFARGAHIGSASEALHHLKSVHQSQILTIGRIDGDIPRQTTKYFINSLGIGLDAAVVSLTNNSKLKHYLNAIGLGSMSYLPAILSAFTHQEAFQMTIINGDQYIQIPSAFLVALTNQPYFGGGIAILPGADLHETQLDIVIAAKMSFFKFLRMFAALKKDGSHLKFHTVHHIKLLPNAQIHVRNIQPSQIDGENLGIGTYEFTVNHQEYPFWL